MKVFIVIDDEAPSKDAVYSIHLSMENAEKSAKELNDMCAGGRVTLIIEEVIEDATPLK
jgi:hypothetical protein